MALGDTGISVTAVRNESAQGNRNYISGLTTSAQVNPYSFWSPRGSIFDPSDSYYLKPVTDISPYQIGDFRRYNHAAQTPRLRATPIIDYSLTPGTTTQYIPIFYDNYEFNFKRADSANEIVKFGLRYYTTLSDAKGNVNPISLVGGSTTVFENITFNNRTIRDSYTPSPAVTGHVVTQTTIPSSSSIMVNMNTTAFPTTGLTTTAVTRFMRLDFYDINDNIKGRLPNYVSGAGATNTGTLVTVGSTTGLFPNMALEVTAGTGAFPTGAYVSTVDSATQFTASAAPSPSLSAGAVVTAYPIMPFTIKLKNSPQVSVQQASSANPQPSGTNVFATTLDYASNTIGATSITFTFKVAHSNYFSSGSCNSCGCGYACVGPFSGYFCMRYKAPDGSFTLVSGKQNVAYVAGSPDGTLGSPTSVSVTFTLPNGRTWNYSDTDYLYQFEVDWNATAVDGCF